VLQEAASKKSGAECVARGSYSLYTLHPKTTKTKTETASTARNYRTKLVTKVATFRIQTLLQNPRPSLLFCFARISMLNGELVLQVS
jgi:hypothetical protein